MPRCSSGCRLILGRVESAEADLELVVAQRWLQHRGDELLSRRIVGAQLVQPRKSPDAVESSGVGGVFDQIESVVSRRVESTHYGALLRGDKNRGVIANCVDQRHVVGLRNRNPPECSDCLFPGGVGKTWKRGDFTQLLADVTSRVFDVYPDSTVVYPGHGDDTTLGAERPHLGEWRERGW
jgi:hypothetical protein